MQSVKSGLSQSIILKDGDYAGINLDFLATWTAANSTALAGDSLVNLQNIVLRAIYTSGKDKYTIYNQDLQTILMGVNYRNGQFEGAMVDSPALWNVLVGAAVGVNYQVKAGYKVPFGTVMNLRGDEQIEVTVQSIGTMFDANINPNTSECQFEAEEGVGVMSAIPQHTFLPIQSDQLNPKFILGDNVTTVRIINKDLNDTLQATAVLSYYTLTSDKYANTDTYYQALSKNYMLFEDPDVAQARFQNYEVVPPEVIAPLNNVRLELKLVSAANVTAGQNFVYSLNWIPTPATLANFARLTEKHAQQNASMVAKIVRSR